MGSIEDGFSGKTSSSSPQSRQAGSETDVAGQVKTGLPTIYSAANLIYNDPSQTGASVSMLANMIQSND